MQSSKAILFLLLADKWNINRRDEKTNSPASHTASPAGQACSCTTTGPFRQGQVCQEAGRMMGLFVLSLTKWMMAVAVHLVNATFCAKFCTYVSSFRGFIDSVGWVLLIPISQMRTWRFHSYLTCWNIPHWCVGLIRSQDSAAEAPHATALVTSEVVSCCLCPSP